MVTVQVLVNHVWLIVIGVILKTLADNVMQSGQYITPLTNVTVTKLVVIINTSIMIFTIVKIVFQTAKPVKTQHHVMDVSVDSG